MSLTDEELAALREALRRDRDVNLPMDDPRDVSIMDVVRALAPTVDRIATARAEARVAAVESLRPDGEREWHNQGRSGGVAVVDYPRLRAALAATEEQA